MSTDFGPFLAASRIIDADHPTVRATAHALTGGDTDPETIAERLFCFVRDEVAHSWDVREGPVTCRASEVLEHRAGYCYAKSHLLAALLRARGIPAAFCYQRLSRGDSGPPYCLHGLNAVWLPTHGWYRIDARGNKTGVDARFCPPVERLAFPPLADEADLPGLYPEPLPSVTALLTSAATIEEVFARLPETITAEVLAGPAE